jgi:hypothetical protein
VLQYCLQFRETLGQREQCPSLATAIFLEILVLAHNTGQYVTLYSLDESKGKDKGKGKGHPRTGHEVPEVE